MFGKNEIVGKKYFDQSDGKLFITSMFVTLQGEGPFRGQPAYFVRFSKCNLACSFCDTYFDNGDWYSLDELDKKIDLDIHRHYKGQAPTWALDFDVKEFFDNIHQSNKKRDMVLVVTGGEPMLQQNIVPFLERMNKQFINSQIESNGLLWQEIPDQTTLVVSPKCHEKNGKATHYLNPNPKVLERADYLKFVMEADKDSPYSKIPDWALAWREKTRKQVFISPMNIYNKEPQKAKQLHSTKNSISIEERSTVDEVISFWEPGLLNMEQNQKNHEYAAKYCLNNGLTFNMQLHLFASLA